MAHLFAIQKDITLARFSHDSGIRIGLVLVLLAAGGSAWAAAAPAARIEQLRQEQEYISAFIEAADLLPETVPDSGADLGALARDLNRVAGIAHESGDDLVCMLAAKAAIMAAETHGDEARSALAEALFWRAKQNRRYIPRAQMNQDLARIDSLLAACPDAHQLRSRLLQFRANQTRTVEGSGAAIAEYQAAVDYRRGHVTGPDLDLADALVWLGWNLNECGRADEAWPVLAEAERELEALGLTEHMLMATILEMRFDGAAAVGDLQACRELAEREVAIRDHARLGILFGDARADAGPPLGYRRLIWVYLSLEEWDAAYRAWSTNLSPVTGEYMRLKQRLAAGPAAARTRLRDTYRQFKQAVVQAEARGTLAQTLTATVTAVQTWANLQDQVREAMAGDAPVYYSPEDVVACLAPGEAILGTIYTEFGGRHMDDMTMRAFDEWLVLMRPGQPLHWIRGNSTAGDKLDRMVLRYKKMRGLINRAAAWPTLLELDPELEEVISIRANEALGPARGHLDGVETLINVGTPLVATISYWPDAPPTTVRTPSIEVFVALAEGRTKAVENPRVLVIGADATQAETGVINVTAEMQILRSVFPVAEVLEGREADQKAVAELRESGTLEAADLIHFAGHVRAGATSSRNALVLFDGLLEAGDLLYGADLSADTVVLSGCASVSGGGHKWHEYNGLAQVLMSSGVRRVVASLWPVDDRATGLLMERFYRNLAGSDGSEGLSCAAALAEASRWLRVWEDTEGNRPFAHPIYWAGFVTFGVP